MIFPQTPEAWLSASFITFFALFVIFNGGVFLTFWFQKKWPERFETIGLVLMLSALAFTILVWVGILVLFFNGVLLDEEPYEKLTFAIVGPFAGLTLVSMVVIIWPFFVGLRREY